MTKHKIKNDLPTDLVKDMTLILLDEIELYLAKLDRFHELYGN